MNLSKLNIVNKRWIYLIAGWAGWLIFVLSIPSNLKYPWDVLNALLALISPYLCYKAALIDRREGEYKNPCVAQKRKPLQFWSYLVSGIAAWGIFVLNIPFNQDYLWKVVQMLVGIVAIFLWLQSLSLINQASYQNGNKSTPTEETRISTKFKTYMYLAESISVPFIFSIAYFSPLLKGSGVDYLPGLAAPFFWTNYYLALCKEDESRQ
jgi:hypothetical protein